MRKRLSPQQAEYLGLPVKPKKNDGSGNPKYEITDEQYGQVWLMHKKIEAPTQEVRNIEKEIKYRGIKEDIEEAGLTTDTAAFGWKKTPKGTFFWRNPFDQNNNIDADVLDVEFLNEIIHKHIKPVEPFDIKPQDVSWADRLIIADVHINMNNHGGSNKLPIYDNPLYDEAEIFRRLEATIKHVVSNQRGENITIDNLGDFMDGEKGQTTRGGHALPQLYSDKKAFEIAVKFKIDLVENLLKYYNVITLNNIIDDNHSFLMSYYVHSTAKKVLELKYPGRVIYNINECFISEYFIGDHRFVISHGKDSVEMKFGWKPKLDDKLVKAIDGYLKHKKLYDGKVIEVSKADSHQYLSDFTTSLDFEYHTYPAFSPPSSWVQHGFGNSRSGVIMQHIDLKSKTKSVTPLFF